MMLHSRPRERPIDIKFKKVRKYKFTTSFNKETSIFASWTEPDYEKLIEKDIKASKISKFVKEESMVAAI